MATACAKGSWCVDSCCIGTAAGRCWAGTALGCCCSAGPPRCRAWMASTASISEEHADEQLCCCHTVSYASRCAAVAAACAAATVAAARASAAAAALAADATLAAAAAIPKPASGIRSSSLKATMGPAALWRVGTGGRAIIRGDSGSGAGNFELGHGLERICGGEPCWRVTSWPSSPSIFTCGGNGRRKPGEPRAGESTRPGTGEWP